MKRRDFIRNSAMGSISMTALGILSCQEQDQKTSQYNDFDLLEATVDDLQQKMKEGILTSEQIIETYLKRMITIEPMIHSVIELNPEAKDIARQMDAERAEGKLRGPLHGIPILIKDNIDTGDQMLTTAGSLALMDNQVTEDAFIVKKLREAGAVLLGKTNLSEWANFRSTRSSSGWSSRGGQTRNPYFLERSPCGSSSGSGAAVSANLSTIAIGTETNGSIVCPSSINGVVGIKPTVGLWSRSGIIPISESQDTAGPMCRTVKDAAILLGALTGVDEKDAHSVQSEGKFSSDYTSFLDKDGLVGAKIGIAKNFRGFHQEVEEVFEKTLEDLKAAGATLVEVEVVENKNDLWGPSYEVLLYEYKDGLQKYLNKSSTTTKMKSLEDLIAYNKTHQKKAMPFFEQEIMERSLEKGDLTSEEYQDALKLVQESSRNSIDQLMKEHGLNAIIAPTNAPSWCIDVVNGDHFIGGSSSPAAWSGYPSVTVPAGFVHGLPIGVSFIGNAFSEGALLKVAYAYEQATKHRRVPEFKQSVI